MIRKESPKQKEDAASSLALPFGTLVLGVNALKPAERDFSGGPSPVKPSPKKAGFYQEKCIMDAGWKSVLA